MCTRIAGPSSTLKRDTNSAIAELGCGPECNFCDSQTKLDRTSETFKRHEQSEKNVNSKSILKEKLRMLYATAFTHQRFCVQHKETVSR